MKSYAIEFYAPAATRGSMALTADRARRAAETLTSEGTPVRYVRSMLIPVDETCFHVFEAMSADAIGLVGRRASLDYERILEVVQ